MQGAAVSVGIFAGQVPGGGGWADAVRGAAGIVQRMRPADAAREAKADHERVVRSELRHGDPPPTRRRRRADSPVQIGRGLRRQGAAEARQGRG